MNYTTVYDFRNSRYIERCKAKYLLFDNKHHDLYCVFADGSRISFIQNDYPIAKIEILSGENLDTAEVVLTMDEPNVIYAVPSTVSFIRWTVIRADRPYITKGS